MTRYGEYHLDPDFSIPVAQEPRDSFDRWLKTFETHEEPPPALRAAPGRHSPRFGAAVDDEVRTAPAARRATEERARALVSLIRQAAASAPVGDVPRLDKNLARFRILAQAERRHADELPCWCGAINWAGVAVHYDDRVPLGSAVELPKPWADDSHDVLGDLQRTAPGHHYDCGCPDHSWWLP